MQNIKYDIEYNYDVSETDGPTFEEINEIMQNTNENKATAGVIKP